MVLIIIFKIWHVLNYSYYRIPFKKLSWLSIFFFNKIITKIPIHVFLLFRELKLNKNLPLPRNSNFWLLPENGTTHENTYSVKLKGKVIDVFYNIFNILKNFIIFTEAFLEKFINILEKREDTLKILYWFPYCYNISRYIYLFTLF